MGSKVEQLSAGKKNILYVCVDDIAPKGEEDRDENLFKNPTPSYLDRHLRDYNVTAMSGSRAFHYLNSSNGNPVDLLIIEPVGGSVIQGEEAGKLDRIGITHTAMRAQAQNIPTIIFSTQAPDDRGSFRQYGYKDEGLEALEKCDHVPMDYRVLEKKIEELLGIEKKPTR